MADPYIQRILIWPYLDGSPEAYVYFYIASPSRVFSDLVQGDQYWFYDQSSANNIAAAAETQFHIYVPTVPSPTPGAAPSLPLGPYFNGPTAGTNKSPYDDHKPKPAPFVPTNMPVQANLPTWLQPYDPNNPGIPWWMLIYPAAPVIRKPFGGPYYISPGGGGQGGPSNAITTPTSGASLPFYY
jgi:hypothetical protein